MSAQRIVFGLYNDETELLSAVKHANAQHLEIKDVLTPFPVHGLDPLLHLSESRLHIVGFAFGALGTLTAFSFMTWVFTRDWPIIFGGKPYFALPSFIPIMFELTVLFSAIAMTVTFYTICGLAPGVTNVVLDERITDNKFCIAFNAAEVDEATANRFFRETGAAEISIKEI